MNVKNKRVVLDVNVWFSIFRNDNLRLIRSFVARNTTLLRSQLLERELERVLKDKEFRWRKPIELYLRFFYNFTVPIPTVSIFKDCRDPDDNYLFDLAIQANADYLVSGDNDVLATPIPPPTKVISYTQLKAIFEVKKPLLNDKPKPQGFFDWLKKDLAKIFK